MNVSGEPASADNLRQTKERELLAKVARREHAALAELYQAYAAPLYSYAHKMLASCEDSEEVLQDAFVRIWRKAPDFDGGRCKPFTWAVMIVRGLCLDRLRKRNKKSAIHSVPLESVPEPHGRADDCISHLFFSESARQVKQAMDTLPAAERECVECVIFSEETHTQIAERLQQPLGTVKARIRRGLIKLRTTLTLYER